jgi:hypothetical protein
VILDGFTYSRIGGRSSCNAKHRKAWLKRQIPEHLGNNYRPQPFEQLVKVLRLMGHDRDAKAIAIAKRRYQSRQNWWPRWVLEKLFLDMLFGYGYRFLWANTVMLGMWVAFALSAETAYMQGAIVPRLDVARLDDDRVKQFEDCRPPKKGDWKDCKMPQLQYQTAFQSWVFALDSILPIPALGARAEWRILSDRPIRIAHTELPGGTVQYVQWVVVGAGWIYGFFFAAFLSGFIKKD